MASVPQSLLLALGQLADGSILRITAKSVVVSLILFVIVGWMALLGFDWGLGTAGLTDGLFAGSSVLRQVAAFLITIIGLWLAWRIIAVTVIGFFADEIVQQVETRHYPDAARRARSLPMREQAVAALRSAGRALGVNLLAAPFALILMVTGLGPALLFGVVNAWLIGRELEDMVWLRHRKGDADLCPIGSWRRFALGGAIAGLLLVPFMSFIAPVLGAAAATHLIHRRT